MPKPISRRDLIIALRTFGWTGPFAGKRHQYLVKEGKRLTIPNPHSSDIDWSLTKQIIAQAEIARAEWDVATGRQTTTQPQKDT